MTTAVLALAKFMCVSSMMCEKYLSLLVAVIQKSPDSIIRGNLVVALGDMAQSFSRLVDHNISYMFDCLGDSDQSVRRNTLMVLTHLTLTGMIKVKGQIGEIAKCLVDNDPRMRDLAKIFFNELAAKDNIIYNHIPDIISCLSSVRGLAKEEDFAFIMKFIFDLIKKVSAYYFVCCLNANCLLLGETI